MYIIKKFTWSLATIFAISIFLFLMLQVIPSDPVLSNLGSETIEQNPELAQKLYEQFELDKPVHERYINWAKRVITNWDLGRSFKYENYTVNELIYKRLGATILLTGFSLVFIVVIGIAIGLLIAWLEGGRLAYLINILSQLGLALPNFWVAIILLGIFGAALGWFPIKSRININDIHGSIRALVLPVITLSIGGVSSVARYLKTSLLQEMDKPYVTVAKSKGLQNEEVLIKHVLKNSLIPVTTIIGLIFISLLTGSIVVENVFSISGIGNLLIGAINTSDYPLIQGIVLYYSVVVVIVSFLLDIVYAIIDPRIRGENEK